MSEFESIRSRLEDVPLLIRFLLSDLAARYGQIVPHFSDDFVARMQSSSWPDNVRQLRNVLERLVARGTSGAFEARDLDGVSPFDDLPCSNREPGIPSSKQLSPAEQAERQLIIDTLEKTGGNVLRASRILGVTREQLRYRVHRKYELSSILPKH